MEVLDEEGNLFGLINVIDALTVLLVLAVVAAGITLVTSDSGDEGPTIESTYVTLDLGQQPSYIVSEINAGDTHSAGDNTQLTLTDVYVAPQDGQTRVIVRAELQAPVQGDGISYEGAPPRLGRTLDIRTDLYEVNGQIRAVGRNETLAREESTVVLQSTLDAADAREVTPGDEIRISGRTLATIEDVTQYATQNPERKRIVVGASLQTIVTDGRQQFGSVPIKQGAEITLETDEYTVSGPIKRIGTTELAESVMTRTVTLRMGPVREKMADAIQPGMTERSSDVTVAQVTDVEVEPSLIIATRDNGTVNVVEHPFNREVILTTELRVRETVNGARFKGQALRQGQTVVIDLGTIVIRATVVSIAG
jgi:hypothetical protein